MTDSQKTALLLLLICRVCEISCDLIPEKPCATLFSSANFAGDEFKLGHFDQSVNLWKDYRASLNGFRSIWSVLVEKDCGLSLCDETYFLGTCQLVTSNRSALIGFKPRSGNCTCPQECKCENISIRKWEFGRAYLNGDCNTCNVQYIQLKETDPSFLNDLRGQVNAFAVRSGCTLTVFSEMSYSGMRTVITAQVYLGFQGTVGSYRFSCDPTSFTPPPHEQPCSYPFMVDLPPTRNKLLQMLSGNGVLSGHPGLQAALESSQSGRSSNCAYVVIIGDDWPRSSGFTECKDVDRYKVSECRVSISLDDLGISNTQLRVITVPLSCCGSNTISTDDRLMATLEKYLSAHDELNGTIPNAVLVWHDIQKNDFENVDGTFQRKLRALHALRGRLLDENYSNLIILVDNLNGLNTSEQRQPELRINQIENAINRNWTFPNPLVLLPKVYHWPHFRYENGYRKMPNEEYWPKNLEVSLRNLCEKGHDPLGKAIFKKYFHVKEIPEYSLNSVGFNLVPATHPKVMYYRKLANEPFLPENSTFKLARFSHKPQPQAKAIVLNETAVQSLCQPRQRGDLATTKMVAEIKAHLQNEIEIRVAELYMENEKIRMDFQRELDQLKMELMNERNARKADAKIFMTELMDQRNALEEDRRRFSAELEGERRTGVITHDWKFPKKSKRKYGSESRMISKLFF